MILNVQPMLGSTGLGRQEGKHSRKVDNMGKDAEARVYGSQEGQTCQRLIHAKEEQKMRLGRGIEASLWKDLCARPSN